MAVFEALYGRRCRSPLFWDEVEERQVQGPELVQQAIDQVELIKKIIITAQDRQANYVNTKRRPLHLQPGEKLFHKVSPFRRVMRFGLRESKPQDSSDFSRSWNVLEIWRIDWFYCRICPTFTMSLMFHC